jgi:hypothetical protein
MVSESTWRHELINRVRRRAGSGPGAPETISINREVGLWAEVEGGGGVGSAAAVTNV